MLFRTAFHLAISPSPRHPSLSGRGRARRRGIPFVFLEIPRRCTATPVIRSRCAPSLMRPTRSQLPAGHPSASLLPETGGKLPSSLRFLNLPVPAQPLEESSSPRRARITCETVSAGCVRPRTGAALERRSTETGPAGRGARRGPFSSCCGLLPQCVQPQRHNTLFLTRLCITKRDAVRDSRPAVAEKEERATPLTSGCAQD